MRFASGLVASGDYEEAIGLLSSAIEDSPHEALYHACRGRLYRLTGRAELALNDLDRAIQLDPSNPYHRAQKAWVLWVQGRRSQSKALLRRTARRNPRYHWALSFLAQQHLVTRQYRAGYRAVRRAVRLAPQCVYTTRILAALQANLGHYRRALTAFERVLAATPDDWTALGEYGLTLAHTGDYPRAVQAFDRALAVAPHLRHLWRDRAAVHLLRGELRRALADCLELLDRFPDEVNVRFLVGTLRHGLGDRAGGDRDLHEAVVQDPRLEPLRAKARRVPTRAWSRSQILPPVGIMPPAGTLIELPLALRP